FAAQLLHEQALGYVLRNHRHETIRGIRRPERYARERALPRDNGNGRNPVRALEKRADHAGHIENLHRARHDGQRFRVRGLARAGLDDAASQAAPRAFVRQKQANGAGPDNESLNICILHACTSRITLARQLWSIKTLSLVKRVGRWVWQGCYE